VADDTAAIQKAVDRACAEGGGVVYLPAGEYKFSGLELDKGVVLMGESKTATTLRFGNANPKTDGTEYVVFRSKGAGSTEGLLGFAKLGVEFMPGLDRAIPVRLFRLGQGSWPVDLSRFTAKRLFIFGNRFDLPLDAPKWTGLSLDAAGPVLIAGNSWKGNGPSWSHGIKRGLVCRNNTFEFANEQVSLSSDRLIFENNTMTGQIIPGVTGSLHGLFTESWAGYNIWNKYVAHNTARNLNFVPGNDGEAFACDSPGFFMMADVQTATADSVELREDSVATSGSIGWHLEWQALVIKGRGLGQLRRVARHRTDASDSKVHHLGVSPAWSVPPDASSKIAVVRLHVGTVFDGNRAVDCCGPAVQFYHACYDCVASANTGTNTQGVINYGGYWGNPNVPGKDRSAMMSYFTTIRDCQVSGASARFKNTWIGDRGEDGLAAAPCFATAIYGSEYRDNIVDRAGAEGVNDYDGKHPAGFCVAIQNPSTTGRSVLGSLFDANTVRNSRHGYAVNSPGCTDVLLARTQFENITDAPVLDKGTRTLRLPAPTDLPSMRGYYLIPCRVQTWDLDQWKAAMDCFAEDGANTVVFWMAGAFRSKKFPETWQHNREHLNVRQDFVRELIDYARSKGIRMLLGLSPFAYDGVNQYPSQHPATRAKNADGSPIAEGGIFSFGHSLCPAVEESQRFMLDYAKEMIDDFYPNADGLFLESTDYGRCQCERCKTHYYEDEFRFVRAISDHVWKTRPNAPIIVYPHYFVNGGIQAQTTHGIGGGQTLDPRWTLFFTPHSADPNRPENRDLIGRARQSLYWDTAAIWGGPWQIRAGAQAARKLGASYFPSLEGYAYRATRREYDGEAFIVGRQLKPCGLEWLADGQHHYRDPLIRLNRLAYREFTRNPDLDDSTFKQIARKELFGAAAKPEAVEDLFYLVNTVLADRQSSFFFASPIVIPPRLEAKAKAENWPPSRIAEYQAKVALLRQLASRYATSTDPTECEMRRIAAFIVQQWDDHRARSTEEAPAAR
jgi:hypothetical protein